MSTPRKPAIATAKADTNREEETAQVVETTTKTVEPVEEGTIEGSVSPEKLQQSLDTSEKYIQSLGKTIDEIVAEKVAEALSNIPSSGKMIETLKVEDGHVTGLTTKEDSNVVQLAEKEVKKVKIKFIKGHSFYINTEKNDAKPGDVLMVERHIANKLVGRHIAYILG